MKKLASILLLLVYGLSSSGMTIQLHYCCGKLKDITLSAIAEKKCGMEHSFSKKKCCDDKQIELKLKSDQKTEQAVKFAFATPVITKPETEMVTVQTITSKAVVPEIFAPPPLQNSLYILHCVYRI